MIITRVVYNSITFRVSAGPPFRAWIRRTEVTSVLSDEARTAISALIPRIGSGPAGRSLCPIWAASWAGARHQ